MNPAAALSISSIRIDSSTQARVELDEEIVAEYAEAIGQGVVMPPIVVFFDGTDHWMGDGFHRYFAHKKAGRESILAEIRQGTKRDALLFAVGANGEHGLRRSNADKHKAVAVLLADAEWAQWTDREIAGACRVSPSFVGKIRYLSTVDRCSETDTAERKFERDGKASTMKTSSINAKREKSPAAEKKAQEKAAQKEHDDAIAASAEELCRMTDELNRANAELLDQVKQLSASDLGAELDKERALRKSAERSQGEAMDRARDFQRELERFGKWFAELRKLTRCDSNGDAMKVIRHALRVAA